MNAQILVVKPKSLTAADKKLLRSAGVVCIEAADPSSVRLLQPEGPALCGDELFYAAIRAVSTAGSDSPAKQFTQTVTRLIEQHLTESTP